MIIINIEIGTGKRTVSGLSITLDDSQTEVLNLENTVTEMHAMMWRFARGFDRRGNIITIKGEKVGNGEPKSATTGGIQHTSRKMESGEKALGPFMEEN